MTTQILNKVLLAVFLTAAGNFGFGAYAFEVSGETFNANFKITSWIAKEDGSTITSEGYLGDKYGQVYLTHNLKGRAGQTNQGRFSGQLRSINNQGEAVVGSLQGVWARDGKIITLHTLDEFSSGMISYAKGSVDLVEGTLKFIVYPID